MRSYLQRFRLVAATALAVGCMFPLAARAAAPTAPSVVSHINVVSDKIEDVSSLDAWEKSFIKPGMTDEQKAVAIWTSVVKFRQQEAPPLEYLDHENQIYDPIKAFNVYGYCMCSAASSYIEALARHEGMEARGWGITGHSVPEIKIKGHWSMFDSSLINYFKNSNGTIAGVEEIAKSVADWYAGHPGFKGDRDKLYHYMANGGWRSGPPVLAGAVGYDNNGWQAAKTHAWGDSMSEFGSPGNDHLYDYCGALGYELNIQLRPGEVLTRNWSNHGLQINTWEHPHSLECQTDNPHDQLGYAPKWGDLAPSRIGNGTLDYDAPLGSADFLKSAYSFENVASKASPAALALADDSKPGTVVIDMPSSYIYLAGTLDVGCTVGNGGQISLEFSDNNGLDWKPLATITTGTGQNIDLTPFIFRRYDYRVRATLTGAGTALTRLHFSSDVQNSQRALPALDKGVNHITFHSGPPEGTIVVEGSTNNDSQGKNLNVTDFHPVLNNMKTDGAIRPTGNNASITFPVETPGDIKRLRVGLSYRARDAKDTWNIEASFDNGSTWLPIGQMAGPVMGKGEYFILDKVPAGKRSALVRFSGVERNTCLIWDERISADYAEPNGGFAPIKITYVWTENGKEMRDEHIAHDAKETYAIHCADKPMMKSITLERVATGTQSARVSD